MSRQLAPGISFCDADGTRVFLDLRRDRYFCLGPAADAAFDALVTGEQINDENEQRLLRLHDAGLLAWDEGPAVRPCGKATIGNAPLDHDASADPAWWRVFAAVLAVQRAKRNLRARGLYGACAAIAALKERQRPWLKPGRPSELANIAATFAASGRIVTTLDQCLALSLALARRCLIRNIAVDLVIGVKTRPFQAHAWVVAGDALISDRSAMVLPFTPILII